METSVLINAPQAAQAHVSESAIWYAVFNTDSNTDSK